VYHYSLQYNHVSFQADITDNARIYSKLSLSMEYSMLLRIYLVTHVDCWLATSPAIALAVRRMKTDVQTLLLSHGKR
jgi:hypothetical protein